MKRTESQASDLCPNELEMLSDIPSQLGWFSRERVSEQLLLLRKKDHKVSDKKWQEFNDDDNKILNCLHYFANIFQPLHLEGWLRILVLGWLYHSLGPKREGGNSEVVFTRTRKIIWWHWQWVIIRFTIYFFSSAKWRNLILFGGFYRQEIFWYFSKKEE